MDQKGPLQVKELKLLEQGKQFWGKYLVMDKNQRRTKDGKEIINLRLGDATGEIDAILWESCQVAGTVQVGVVLAILGDIGSFNGKPQITAKRVKVSEEDDPANYVKGPDIPLDLLKQRFFEALASIQDPYLGLLLEKLFTEEQKQEFFHAPAAKRIHHNYAGGLLEHTMSVAALCEQAAGQYPELNRDLLVTGALLHDIGKITEYALQTVPQYTIEGRLIGHIVTGSEMISGAIAQLRADGLEFPQKLEWMLKHMILSHHGNLEYGSPVVPMFAEAFVLHSMDNLDAKLFVYRSKMEEQESEEDPFTAYDPLHGHQFFTYRYKGKN